jgi:hypothetical protein
MTEPTIKELGARLQKARLMIDCLRTCGAPICKQRLEEMGEAMHALLSRIEDLAEATEAQKKGML